MRFAVSFNLFRHSGTTVLLALCAVVPSFAQTTVRISRGFDGTGGDGESIRPSISADGRYVAFESAASNLVVGDDFGFALMPHGDYVSEFEVYVKQLGIPAIDVLRWATSNGAKLMAGPLGVAGELGSIEAGKLADLLVVDGDPAADISCLRDRVVAIVKDGVFVRDAL